MDEALRRQDDSEILAIDPIVIHGWLYVPHVICLGSLATIARDLFSLVARLYPNRKSGQPAARLSRCPADRMASMGTVTRGAVSVVGLLAKSVDPKRLG